jgi:hypothetical protein
VIEAQQKPQVAVGPMDTKIAIPVMESIDWDALEFLSGPGSFGKEYKHPLWKFGTLNKYLPDTGWKLRSGRYFAVTEEIDKQLQEEHGIFLAPREDPSYDDQGRLHFRECIHFYMTHEFYNAIQKVLLLRSLGHQPSVQNNTNKMVHSQLAKSGGKFTDRDLSIKVTEDYNLDATASQTPVTEKEKNLGSTFEGPEKMIGL